MSSEYSGETEATELSSTQHLELRTSPFYALHNAQRRCSVVPACSIAASARSLFG